MSALDPHVLQLYRYFWQPAKYAHPDWLCRLGIQSVIEWRYQSHAFCVQAVNRVLRQRLALPAIVLPATLTTRQKQRIESSNKITSLALAIGLMQLACGDYFLLPDYRAVIKPWLSDEISWRLFGLCRCDQKAAFPPEVLIKQALEIGTALLHRQARTEVTWYPFLALLPPPRRALWPKMSDSLVSLLEKIVCITNI